MLAHPVFHARSAALAAVLLGMSCQTHGSQKVEDLYRFPAVLSLEEVSPTRAPDTSLIDAIGKIRAHVPQGELVDARLARLDGQLNCYARIWEGSFLHAIDMDLARGEVNFEATVTSMSPAPLGQKEFGEQMTGLIDPAAAIATATSTIDGSWARAIEVRGRPDAPTYVVEVVAGNEVQEVVVLARSGTLIGCTPLPRVANN